MSYKALEIVDVIPCLPNLARGSATPLKASPDGKKLCYALGRTVVIRDIVPVNGMIKAQLYTQHQYEVTAVAMAPSGCYMATGDKNGTLRIWACDNPEQILKLETVMFGGAILDIAWSADNQRVVAVGDGREIFGKVIMWDSGNSVGEIGGHAKKVNSCAFKQTRPFRICTGGEDGKVNFFEGPPFKFKSISSTHTNFVNTVRFDPQGKYFFSVSNDMMLKTYDGKDGSLLKECKPHSGTIYGGCWSGDGSKLMTCSADKSVKVFAVADGGETSEVATYSFGKTADCMQVGCVWAGSTLLSYSLNGALSLLSEGAELVSTQFGHNRPITSMAMSGDKLISGSHEDAMSPGGVIREWDLTTGLAKPFKGADGSQKGGHTSMVIKLAVRKSGEVVTIGRDDSLLVSSADGIYGSKVPLDAAPVDMGCGSALVAIVTNTKELKLATGAAIDATVPLDAPPTCVAVAPNDSAVAVGAEDNAIYMYDSKGASKGLKLERHRDTVSCVAFSPDSSQLASGCANKELIIWSVADGTPLITGLSGYHTTRIACLTWASDGSVATGGVDSTIFVWTPETLKDKKPGFTAKLTHTGGGVTALAFVNDKLLASSGQDACIKFWKI